MAEPLPEAPQDVLNNSQFLSRFPFPAFRDFQSSSAVFTNWKSDIMVYNEEVFDGFVRESTRFTSWDEMVRTAADRAFSDKKE